MRRAFIDDTAELDDPMGRVQARKGRYGLWIGLLLASSLFVIIPVLVLLANRSYAERCTERVTAIVAENRRVNRDKVTYRPVFEYSYQGRKYLTASNTSSNPPAFEVGEKVELYLDPDDPAKIYVPGDKTIYIVCGILGGIGAVLVLLLLIKLIIEIKDRNKPDCEIVEMKYY